MSDVDSQGSIGETYEGQATDYTFFSIRNKLPGFSLDVS